MLPNLLAVNSRYKFDESFTLSLCVLLVISRSVISLSGMCPPKSVPHAIISAFSSAKTRCLAYVVQHLLHGVLAALRELVLHGLVVDCESGCGELRLHFNSFINRGRRFIKHG